jgi:hypothetical protein
MMTPERRGGYKPFAVRSESLAGVLNKKSFPKHEAVGEGWFTSEKR